MLLSINIFFKVSILHEVYERKLFSIIKNVYKNILTLNIKYV